MSHYAVIDTNVLVSALLARRSDSAVVLVVEKVFEGSVVPVFSKDILEEYSVVLHREKFGFDPATVNSFLYEIKLRGIMIEAVQETITLSDVKDIPFYAVSLAAKEYETFLVTGNIKHFPDKPFIVTPAQFIELIQKMN
jgi:putative PIN family toxin of toxin-antitoxin system